MNALLFPVQSISRILRSGTFQINSNVFVFLCFMITHKSCYSQKENFKLKNDYQENNIYLAINKRSKGYNNNFNKYMYNINSLIWNEW